jgi:hypothetical protein
MFSALSPQSNHPFLRIVNFREAGIGVLQEVVGIIVIPFT